MHIPLLENLVPMTNIRAALNAFPEAIIISIKKKRLKIPVHIKGTHLIAGNNFLGLRLFVVLLCPIRYQSKYRWLLKSSFLQELSVSCQFWVLSSASRDNLPAFMNPIMPPTKTTPA